MGKSYLDTTSVAGLLLFAAIGSSCLATPEDIAGSSEALITPVTSNYLVASGYTETSVAYAAGSSNWLVGYNGPNVGPAGYYTVAGWSYSSDAAASSWTPKTMSAYDAFGNPGVSPTNGTRPFAAGAAILPSLL